MAHAQWWHVVKQAIKRVLRAIGYDLHRITPTSNQLYDLGTALSHFGVDVVLDVGANAGQFAARLRGANYQGRIVSFEPLRDEHRKLSELASRDPNWSVHQRSAIGDVDAEVTINVAGNSVSSSVLPMMDLHAIAARGSAYIGTQVVPIARLDTVAPPYLEGSCNPFLKVDAQGFESQVLDGACETLHRVRGVLCELSLVQLYEGQVLWREMIDRLEGLGFEVWSVAKGFTDQRTGRTLQVDAAFFRA